MDGGTKEGYFRLAFGRRSVGCGMSAYSGSIKINPDALHDPAAINVEATATDVDPRALARQAATTGFDNSISNANGSGDETRHRL